MGTLRKLIEGTSDLGKYLLPINVPKYVPIMEKAGHMWSRGQPGSVSFVLWKSSCLSSCA